MAEACSFCESFCPVSSYPRSQIFLRPSLYRAPWMEQDACAEPGTRQSRKVHENQSRFREARMQIHLRMSNDGNATNQFAIMNLFHIYKASWLWITSKSDNLQIGLFVLEPVKIFTTFIFNTYSDRKDHRFTYYCTCRMEYMYK